MQDRCKELNMLKRKIINAKPMQKSKHAKRKIIHAMLESKYG
jgi:hypothetical protein